MTVGGVGWGVGVLEETANVESERANLHTGAQQNGSFIAKDFTQLKLHMWCTGQAAVFPLDIKGGFVWDGYGWDRNKDGNAADFITQARRRTNPPFVDTAEQH